MRKVVGLLSSSLLTQLALIAIQFILLPIQLERWGHSVTADWYAGLAVAAIATVADGGLRSIGHDSVIRAPHDPEARERFGRIWLACRLLILGVTAALLGGNLLGGLLTSAIPFSAWRAVLILAFALETLVIVRIVYMDSLGLYHIAEYGYLALVVLRLILALVAMLALDGGETLLACAYLASSVVGLALQEWSCRTLPALRLSARPIRTPSPRGLAVLRYTIADPVAGWMRLSLPVLVITAIGTDYAVTAFVALRAVFAAMRNMLHQLARAGSVEFLALLRGDRVRAAADVLSLFLTGGTWIAAAFGAAVLIDDYTLTRLWLADLVLEEYRLFALTLAFGAVFYPYQLLVNVQIRGGQVARVAARQYVWIAGTAALVARARAVAERTAASNGLDGVRVDFPDRGAMGDPPLRVRVRGGEPRRVAGVAFAADVAATAEMAPAAPPTDLTGDAYDGPLATRLGKTMRPDVALAFDRLQRAATRDGQRLVITSGFRSDAEQAKLFAARPDPKWVARPGTSLHRMGTELDLGPPGAYGWLAAQADEHGFERRYSWEPWHFGFTREARSTPNDIRDGERGALQPWVPARYAPPIRRAAVRWKVSAALLAAQLKAESNFDPNARSPVGASGIAQFMPATAAAYGLRDPTDPEAAIDAQGKMMSGLLRQFGSVPLALAAYNAGPGAVQRSGGVPPYPETRHYVARILALMRGHDIDAGLLDAMPIRLVA